MSELKQRCTTAWVLMCLSTAVLAAGLPQGIQAPVKPAGALRFEAIEHDFGKIPDTTPVLTAFKFTNASDSKTVTIGEVHTSCGCTIAALTKKTYSPHESGQIDVTFNPQHKQGRDVKVITVATDDVDAPKIELRTLSDVVAQVMIEPLAVWFGEVRYDTIATAAPVRPLVITSRIAGFAINSASVDDKRFKIRLVGTEPADVDGVKVTKSTYELKIDSNLPIGRVQAAATFSTNYPERPTIAIPLFIDAFGELRVSPDRVNLIGQVASEAIKSEVIVQARSNKPFKILSVDAKGPEGLKLAATFEELPQPRGPMTWRIRLTGVNIAVGNQMTGTMTVKTDIAEQPEVVIPITAFVPMTAPPAPIPASAPAK